MYVRHTHTHTHTHTHNHIAYTPLISLLAESNSATNIPHYGRGVYNVLILFQEMGQSSKIKITKAEGEVGLLSKIIQVGLPSYIIWMRNMDSYFEGREKVASI